ncbi:hypothetical protein [Methylocella silvestris]|uniref:DUF2946 domain-containing protein n=1 Tax=Methylocella silvestris TaxID=199596 RepID=A0A2J7THT3_METSI|nr:hypothetical protein [Methylocella silvestris]PNG26319.1 hypothetical protein CR492_09400 [Methylocella silvestris]
MISGARNTPRGPRWPGFVALAAAYLFALQTIAFAALAAAEPVQGDSPSGILCQSGRAPGEPQRHSDSAHCLVACAVFSTAAAPALELAVLPARSSNAAVHPAGACARCSAALAHRTPHNPRAPPTA